MNPEQREIFRTSLLRVLEERASERFGLGVTAIIVFLGQYGFRNSTAAAVNTELAYLADKQLAVTVGKTISPENACWRITATGRDHLAQS